jgi:hypothetical protein
MGRKLVKVADLPIRATTTLAAPAPAAAPRRGAPRAGRSAPQRLQYVDDAARDSESDEEDDDDDEDDGEFGDFIDDGEVEEDGEVRRVPCCDASHRSN